MLKHNERIENIGFSDLKLIQSADEFRFGLDAVLLADFASSFVRGSYSAVDLGTGTGVVPLIMSSKSETGRFLGIEVRAAAADMAARSFRLNGLEDRLSAVDADVLQIVTGELDGIQAGSADVVTTNPPYVEKGCGPENDCSAKLMARRETTASLENFIEAAAWLLREKGHFCMVHRPARLVDIIYFCRKHALEPKDMRLVAPRQGEAPNIVLIHCVRGGGKELKLDNTLYVYEENGEYSDEIMEIYGRDKGGKVDTNN